MGQSSDCSPGFYRIRNSNGKLCLTQSVVGKGDQVEGSNVYVDDQQEAENQKWCVRSHDNSYIIESALSPEFYLGIEGEVKKYAVTTVQKKKTKWELVWLFGSSYTIVELSKKFAIGFPDYLPSAGDSTTLMNNVEAQCQIWYLEPWDSLKPDEGFLPTADTSFKDGIYQIVNVATGFLIAATSRGGWLSTKQKDRDLTYAKWTLKRVGDYVTLYNAAVGTYLNIGPGLLVTISSGKEEFVLAKQKGERGVYIMSKNETKPRRVIVDNRQTPEGFEFYPADLKKGDPTQRWELKPYT